MNKKIIGLISAGIMVVTGLVGAKNISNNNIIEEMKENTIKLEEMIQVQENKINELEQLTNELENKNEQYTDELETINEQYKDVCDENESLKKELEQFENLKKAKEEEIAKEKEQKEKISALKDWGVHSGEWAPDGYRFIAENNNYHHSTTYCNHIDDNRQTKIVPEGVQTATRIKCKHC